jgi:hypothetical protein
MALQSRGRLSLHQMGNLADMEEVVQIYHLGLSILIGVDVFELCLCFLGDGLSGRDDSAGKMQAFDDTG